MATQSAFGVLKGCALFQGLVREELQWLEKNLARKNLAKGDTLFRQGDPSRGAYIILDGELGVRSPALNGEGGGVPFAPVIATFGAGEVIGEFALLDSQPRSAEVFAVRPSVVLTLEQETMEKLAGIHPTLGYRIMRNLAQIVVQRMRRTNEKFAAVLQWTWKPAARAAKR